MLTQYMLKLTGAGQAALPVYVYASAIVALECLPAEANAYPGVPKRTRVYSYSAAPFEVRETPEEIDELCRRLRSGL